MDKSLLKKAALQSVALMIAVITLSYALEHYQTITTAASNLISDNAVTASTKEIIDLTDRNTQNQIETVAETSLNKIDVDKPINDIQDLKRRIRDDILAKLGDDFIVIKKPKGDQIAYQLNDLYINHSIQLDVSGMKDAISQDMILRVRGDQLFMGEPQYTEVKSKEVDEDSGETKEVTTKDYGLDFCHGITITPLKDKNPELFDSSLLIELDSVYAYLMYEDENYIYIDLRKPSEVYDKVIVIDAGHGGKDVGAISKGDQYYEKNINLDILLELKKLLDKETNIKVYYTRTADETVYLRPRVTLANEVDCDYFISIHCNANVLAYPNGTEVLYYNNEVKGVKTSNLAKLFSNEIAKNISLKQRGIVQRHLEDLYIMDNSLVPTILIEVGYLTNSDDMNYLGVAKNREDVAKGIFNSIIKAYEELPVTEK